MKKSISLFFFLLISLFTISCSNDDKTNSNISIEEQTLIGTWEVVARGTVNSSGLETIYQNNNSCLNTYKFTTDRNVNYKSYISCADFNEENGTWSLIGGILTRTFPEVVTIVMKHNITFINPDKIKLFKLGNNTEFSIYQRQGSTLQDTSFNVELTGTYQINGCNAIGNTTKIKFEFMQDNNVFATQNEQSNIEKAVTVNKNLSGSVIGVKIKLTDYNLNNLNATLGDGFENLHLKITGNQTQDILINSNPNAWLASCTDICYEILLLYDTRTKKLTVESLWH